jgi:hypothetical protein
LRSTARTSLGLAALLYSVLHFAVTGVRQPLANFYGDFLASFPTWRVAWLCGRLDWYFGSLAQRWGPPPIWHYGPLLHAITLPLFACSSLRSAYVVWLFVNYLFVAAAAFGAMWVIDDGKPTPATVLLVIVVFCNFNPLYEALTERTIENFELLLLFVAWSFYRRGRDIGCGVAIGIAAMMKFLPLIYLPWLVLRRRGRALAAAIAVIVPVAIITELILGWRNSGTLIQLGGVTFLNSELDQSLSGMVTRLISWTHCPLPAPVAGLVVILIALGVLMAFMLEARRREGSEEVEFGLLAAVMVLLPPHNQEYYFVFLLLPYALLYRRYRTGWSPRAALLALSFALVAVPVPLSIVQRLIGVDVFSLYLRAGIPFVGAALLVAVLVSETARPVQFEGP